MHLWITTHVHRWLCRLGFDTGERIPWTTCIQHLLYLWVFLKISTIRHQGINHLLMVAHMQNSNYHIYPSALQGEIDSDSVLRVFQRYLSNFSFSFYPASDLCRGQICRAGQQNPFNVIDMLVKPQAQEGPLKEVLILFSGRLLKS